MKSAPSLSFEASPSSIALALTLAIAVLAIWAGAASGLAIEVKLALAALIVSAGVRHLQLRRSASSPRCTLQSEGDWLLVAGNTETRVDLHRSHDLGFLIALHFRSELKRRIDVVLWPDSIPPDARRRLRVWLGRQGGLR